MAVFARLGPKAREAIANAPWEVDVAEFVRRFDRTWRDPLIARGEFPGELPILSPEIDQSLADLIRDKIRRRDYTPAASLW